MVKRKVRRIMKKLFVSVGLAAAGTASLFAAYAPGLDSMQTTKIWSVSSTLRGFYDDNYTTSPNAGGGDVHKQGSAGFEVNPEIQLNVPLQQTEFGLKYDYGLYYYQDRQNNGNNPIDQSHQIDLYVDHAFTERVQGKVDDTLAIGQEPQLLNSGGSAASSNPYRVNGNNLANNATVSLTTDWTRQFSTLTTYRNGYYDYQNDGTTTNNLNSNGNPSLSAVLNRIDQSIGTDFQWHVAPETIALVGYMFDWVNYTGDQPIAINATASAKNPYFYSDSRNTISHIGYIGGQHNFLANLSVSAKVGVQATDNYNESPSSTTVNPWAALSATYTYAPGSYVQLGFNQLQNATDVVAPASNGKITQNQESSVVFVTVNHQITKKLLATAIANFQNSIYNGGASANEADQDYNFGLNFTYSFTQHFSAQLGYNFDDLQSDIPDRAYSRNRVYLGVTAAY
jgi:Putative beta-barrel porin 2